MKHIFLSLLFLAFFACSKQVIPTCEKEPFDQYKPVSQVSDFANMLNAVQTSNLIKEIKAVNQRADIRLAIITINELPEGMTIAEFTVDWAGCYGVGEKGKNNGVVLGVSQKERTVFLATGKGIEQQLTDEECAIIIEEEINKNFRNGYYVEGLREAIEKIGEYVVE